METEHDKANDHLIFEECSKIEARFAELYNYYSELFSDNVDAAELWKKVAAEEEDHLRQFEFANRIYRWADFTPNVQFARVRNVSEKMDALLGYVRLNPPQLETALRKSIEIEEALADLHMTSAVMFADENTQNLFKAMAKSEQGHIESLRRYLNVLEISHAEMNG